ncbi:trypsin-like peptidase domain-containing protein [Streptomyces sp. NPDC051554]|uniref:trypsin-like peptidase domain-containing protein n=1 Tax=Streptomyces sp. NPDC051554 TaxID=3365656 RepID=UPI0037A1834E
MNPDGGRVAVVRARRQGSGYLLTPRLVLTAAHVVRYETRVHVAVPGGLASRSCSVFWRPDDDRTCDAALLLADDDLVDATAAAAFTPVVWGEIDTLEPQERCTALGFPNVQRDEQRRLQSDQIMGTVSAGSALVGAGYVFDNPGGVAPDPGMQNPWSGFSGGAVFCAGTLLGLVTTATPNRQHRRLGVTPARTMLETAGFAEALESGGAPGGPTVPLSPRVGMAYRHPLAEWLEGLVDESVLGGSVRTRDRETWILDSVRALLDRSDAWLHEYFGDILHRFQPARPQDRAWRNPYITVGVTLREGARDIADDLSDLRYPARVIALLGEPGIGKSRLLVDQAVRWSERLRSVLNEVAPVDTHVAPARIPLRISLADWTESDMHAREFLEEQVKALAGDDSFFYRHFSALLDAGAFVLLLDGLDRLPGRRVASSDNSSTSPVLAALLRSSDRTVGPRERSLRDLLASNTRITALVTCRTHLFSTTESWTAAWVQPMTDAAINKLISVLVPTGRENAVRAWIDASPRLTEMARSPFFLLVLLGISRAVAADRELPAIDSRGFALQTLYETTVLREQPDVDEADPSDWEARREALRQRLARVILTHRSRSGTVPIGLPSGVLAGADLALLTGAGLLRRTGGSLRFSHQLFEEYFAAYGLGMRSRPPSPLRLLAAGGWTDAVTLWCDLQPDRLEPVLNRGLRARNFPGRRRSLTLQPGIPLIRSLITYVSVGLSVNAVVDHAWRPLALLAAPVRLTPQGTAGVLLTAWLLALAASWFTWNSRLIGECAYVLGNSIRTMDTLPALIRSFRRVDVPGRSRVAEGIGFFGADVVPQLETAVRVGKLRDAVGCVHAIAAVRKAAALPSVGLPPGLEADEERFQVNRAAAEIAYGEDVRTAVAAVRALAEMPFRRRNRVLGYLGERLELRQRELAEIPEPERRLFNEALNADNITFGMPGTEGSDEKQRLKHLAAFLPELLGWFRLSGCEQHLLKGAAAAIRASSSGDNKSRRFQQIRGRNFLTCLGHLQSEAAMIALGTLSEQIRCDWAEQREYGWCAAMSAAIRLAYDPVVGPAAERNLETARCIHVKAALAAALARVCVTPSPRLDELAASPVTAIRRAVVEGLSYTVDDGAVALLCQTVQREGNLGVFRAGLDSLSLSPAPTAAEVLGDLVRRRSGEARRLAIAALSSSQVPQAREVLVDLANNGPAVTRASAAGAARRWRADGQPSAGAAFADAFALARLRPYRVRTPELRRTVRESERPGDNSRRVALRAEHRMVYDSEMRNRYLRTTRLMMLLTRLWYSRYLVVLLLSARIGQEYLAIAPWDFPVPRWLATLLFVLWILLFGGKQRWKWFGFTLMALALSILLYLWWITIFLVVIVVLGWMRLFDLEN